MTSEQVTIEEVLFVSFPYMLIEREDGKICWSVMDRLEDETVVYDGPIVTGKQIGRAHV